MKTIILAGGQGTRIAEETTIRPKPLVEIGGRPILWHIMMVYSAAHFYEFVIALGYKGDQIKAYFLNFHFLNNDLTIDLSNGATKIHSKKILPWSIHLIDTGDATQTGGRIRRLRDWIGNETFMLTYGDGLANIDVERLVAFHQEHGKLATMTAVRPPSRFGGVSLNGDQITDFAEKPQIGEGWINGGFFVLEPKVIDYIDSDSTIWERSPLEKLSSEGQLMAYKHEGFWLGMDTIRERSLLEQLWTRGEAPWKIW